MADGALEGQGVLVTGGGTGIGRACAAALAADGAVVTICGRTEATLAESQEVIEPGHGGSVGYGVADVTDESSVQVAGGAAVEAAGNLAGGVANAGGGGGMGPDHVQDTDEFLRVLHLIVLGTMLGVKHAVPHLVANGGGSVVGMSSIAGHVTHPNFGAYPVAKAGIEQMRRNAADEFGRSNVRLTAVRPGFIATELMSMIPTDSDVYDSYVRNTPMGDVGQPEDVGNLVRFLIGPESRWITGTCINVDGGNALRAGPDFSQFVAPSLGDDVMSGNLPD